jgi:hypothetical protein
LAEGWGGSSDEKAGKQAKSKDRLQGYDCHFALQRSYVLGLSLALVAGLRMSTSKRPEEA